MHTILILAAPFAAVGLIAWLWPPKGKRMGSFWTEGDEESDHVPLD